MQLGGPTIVPNFHLPSSSGIFRLNDLVVMNDKSFTLYGNRGPVVSQYAHIQLFNPAGSGVTLLLDELRLIIASTIAASIGWYNTELGTDVGVGASRSQAAVAALGHVRIYTGVSRLGTYFDFPRGLTATTANLPFSYPIPLAEGKGLVVVHSLTNSEMACTFAWREV